MPIFTTRVNLNNTNRGTNGRHRVGDLTADAAGDLVGMTALGGADNFGTMFDIPSIDGTYGGTLTLTGSASLANYQAALESITFSSTSGNPSNSRTDLSRTVSWTVNDGTLSSNTITPAATHKA